MPQAHPAVSGPRHSFFWNPARLPGTPAGLVARARSTAANACGDGHLRVFHSHGLPGDQCDTYGSLVQWTETSPCKVIGVVRSAHTELSTTPIQAGLNRAEHGTLEIDDRYPAGLDGLADFDYAWLLTWLDKLGEPGTDPPLRQVPFLLRSQQRAMGMFAAHGPWRINPIGLSLIQLLDVTGQTIRFAGVRLGGRGRLDTLSRR